MEDEILRKALAPGPDCLPLERLGRYADGALDGKERAAAGAHIAECLSCQAELALLQELTSTGAAAGRTASSWRRWSRPSVAMAAVLVLGIAAGGVYFLAGRRAPRLPRDVTPAGEVTRSASVAVERPVGEQIESPRRFEWHGVNGAVSYRVRLMEVDRREVWSAWTSTLGADLPNAIRLSIAPGRTLLWEVTAHDAAGNVVAESGSQSFRVRPR